MPSPLSAISYNFTTVPLTDQLTGAGQLELTLSQLHKAAKYLVVIRAFNRYGEGPLSSPITVTTLEDGTFCKQFHFVAVRYVTLFSY